MFYLLEDNRIIDEDKRAKEGQILYVVDNSLHCTSLYEIKWLGKIKKQSENVFDLIEKGDLVKTIVDSIYQVVMIAKNTIIAPQWAFDLAVVTAIYKPDSNGDYIKVWEVKE